MKLLLVAINAKYIHSNLAVYSLRAYAEKFQESIEIGEYTINNRSETILADIYRRNPQVIAFSCYIWNWTTVQELLEELPKVMPGRDIWLGGPEVSYEGEKILKKYPHLTGIMTGEGEQTFRELMQYYCLHDRELTDVSGLYLPGKGLTGPREAMDLDEIPFYYREPELFANRILYYESSRGCPYRCSYCLSSIDKKVRLRSFDKVKAELDIFLKYKVPQVKFVDRTFNCNHEHALQIWNYLLENDNGITNFHFEISAHILTQEELSVLEKMRPGYVQLEIGVQSVNPETIREIRRTTDLDRLKWAIRKIREGRNIHIHLDLIAGLPYENYDSFVISFNTVYGMEPNQLQLGFLKVLKGSYLHEKILDYGIYYRSIPPYEVLYSKWLSYKAVLRLKRVEEMVELYYNSCQFRHTLQILVRAFESPFRLYERLADFYEEKGYFVHSPSRVKKYEVLLEFACLTDPEKEALYRELLTYDIYLREKCKSRPSFARDLAPYREELRRRERDKKEHIDVFFYPVWDMERLQEVEMTETAEAVEGIEKPRELPVFVQFSYEKRDPLSREAEVKYKFFASES